MFIAIMLRIASLQRGLMASAYWAGRPGLRSPAAAIIFALWSHAPASSQTPGPDGNYRIEAIVLAFEGTKREGAAGRAFEGKLRSELNIFPGSTYGNLFVDFGLQKVRRLPGVKDARLVLLDGDTGEVDPGVVGRCRALCRFHRGGTKPLTVQRTITLVAG